ncbi:winged helix-turn-helix domain-containing protein [Rhizobium sp. CG5]|uniref:winged helix-turn-helix domain-containing protein n=1 Tax=Rhizobium sp. CG5 TaxID=2726076 RepID=UPI0020335C0E|nr:winged helix-turn-helix domain-containing protein [Rhizobium sp. CG5]
MAIPDYQSLMLPVLRLAADGETRVPDAAEKLADQLGLSVAEREEVLPSGRQRIFHNRIHWAKFYMTKAGLIDSPARGRFVASSAGRALLATNPAGINVDTLKTYPAFAEFYASSTSGTGSTDAASTGAGETIDATTSAMPDRSMPRRPCCTRPCRQACCSAFWRRAPPSSSPPSSICSWAWVMAAAMKMPRPGWTNPVTAALMA